MEIKEKIIYFFDQFLSLKFKELQEVIEIGGTTCLSIFYQNVRVRKYLSKKYYESNFK